jgi:hypothetical protein
MIGCNIGLGLISNLNVMMKENLKLDKYDNEQI